MEPISSQCLQSQGPPSSVGFGGPPPLATPGKSILGSPLEGINSSPTSSPEGKEAASHSSSAPRRHDTAISKILFTTPHRPSAPTSAVLSTSTKIDTSSHSSSAPRRHDTAVSKILFTPPRPSSDPRSAVHSTPAKIRSALLRAGRLMMWAHDPKNPSPSTIQTRFSTSSANTLERVYPLDPKEIAGPIADHAELRNQLAYLLIYTYHNQPYGDKIRVGLPNGPRTTFQFGHTIDTNYSSAHASCTPRIQDNFFDLLITDLRGLSPTQFQERVEFFRKTLQLILPQDAVEQKLKEVEEILQNTASSTEPISLRTFLTSRETWKTFAI